MWATGRVYRLRPVPCSRQLADLNKRLPAEACLPPAKPVGRPARYERQLAARPSTPHTITLQPSSFRNLRLPKRLRVVYFLARTRLAQRLIMVPAVLRSHSCDRGLAGNAFPAGSLGVLGRGVHLGASGQGSPPEGPRTGIWVRDQVAATLAPGRQKHGRKLGPVGVSGCSFAGRAGGEGRGQPPPWLTGACTLQAGTVVWIGILVYTDPAGLRTYLAAQVTEQSPLGEGSLASMPVPSGVLPASRVDPAFAIFPPDAPRLPENQTLPGEQPEQAGPAESAQDGPVPEVTWGPEDEERWRELSFRHWPTLFSYYNITLAKR